MLKLVFEYSHRIFEYIRIFELYTHLCPIDPFNDLLGGTCIENMRYMYMHGIVSRLYQWRHVRNQQILYRKLDNLEVFYNDKSLVF